MRRIQSLFQIIDSNSDLLIAARGPNLDLISISDAILISTWKCPLPHTTKNSVIPQAGAEGEILSDNRGDLPEVELSPPPKKTKLVQSGTSQKDRFCKKIENSESEDGKARSKSPTEPPVITLLACTADGKHVVIVTGEDKSVRVLEIVGTGKNRKVTQLSQRLMPKRPCALAITDDDNTVISADKFGDVYSLPLLHLSSAPVVKPMNQNSKQKFECSKPAANEFTVHSQRNKKALLSQRLQKHLQTQKLELNFEHKLLLGHMSMLTDIKLTTIDRRSYVITSDRDEHIRVSRGIPQTHVIENYCLGHTEFVSRLCIPKTKPTILISGGGENELFIWNWKYGTLFSKKNLRDYIAAVINGISLGIEYTETTDNQMNFAVSEILHAHLEVDGKFLDFIIVSCESLPAFFTFTLSSDNTLQYSETIRTPGNILSMIVASDQNSISESLLVSIDIFHKPGSTTDIQENYSPDTFPLWQFSFQGKFLKGQPLKIEIPVDENTKHTDDKSRKLFDLLYGLENLRKRGNAAEV